MKCLFLFISFLLPISVSAKVIDLKVKGITIGASYSTVVRSLESQYEARIEALFRAATNC